MATPGRKLQESLMNVAAAAKATSETAARVRAGITEEEAVRPKEVSIDGSSGQQDSQA